MQFKDRIRIMNNMYCLAVNDVPVLPADPAGRLEKFEKTLSAEVAEIHEIIRAIRDPFSDAARDHVASAYGLDAKNASHQDQIDAICRSESMMRVVAMVAIADLLSDITVYCRSEAMKFGLPLEEMLDIVMDSNESKLGPDGQPIYDENKKFMKGPNYWKPEPKMREVIELLGSGDDVVPQGDWS